MAIQDYFSSAVGLDVDQVQNGNPTLPNLKKLLKTICKNLNRYKSAELDAEGNENPLAFLNIPINEIKGIQIPIHQNLI